MGLHRIGGGFWVGHWVGRGIWEGKGTGAHQAQRDEPQPHLKRVLDQISNSFRRARIVLFSRRFYSLFVYSVVSNMFQVQFFGKFLQPAASVVAPATTACHRAAHASSPEHKSLNFAT